MTGVADNNGIDNNNWRQKPNWRNESVNSSQATMTQQLLSNWTGQKQWTLA